MGVFTSDLPRRNSPYYRYISTWIAANQNIFLNAEFTLDNTNSFIVAPKIGYEINCVVFTVRLSDVCYFSFDGSKPDNRLLIEGGITLLGFVNLCYGYSLPLSPDENKFISKHKITLRLNLFPWL